jgi:hypothetical protein
MLICSRAHAVSAEVSLPVLQQRCSGSGIFICTSVPTCYRCNQSDALACSWQILVHSLVSARLQIDGHVTAELRHATILPEGIINGRIH